MGKKKYVIDKKYLEPEIDFLDFKGRLVIFDPSHFREQFKEPKYLICRAYDGAGCRYTSIGTALYVENIFDKEKYRDSRWNILNVVKVECEQEVIDKYCV